MANLMLGSHPYAIAPAPPTTTDSRGSGASLSEYATVDYARSPVPHPYYVTTLTQASH